MDKEGIIISVIDIRGGSKVNNFSVNLAKNFVNVGRVLLLDFDPQGKSSKYLKVSQKFSILNILNRNKDFHEVVQKTDLPNFFVLPANVDITNIEKDEKLNIRVLEVVKYLKTKFDVIIIETPPYINSLISNLINSSNTLLTPLKIEVFSTYFTEQLIQKLGKMESKLKLIPTNYEDTNILNYSEIVQKHSKYLFKSGSTSIKIDIDKKDFNKIMQEIIEVIKNDK